MSSGSAGSGLGTRDRLPIAVLVPAGELAAAARGPNLSAAAIAIDELSDKFRELGEFVGQLPAIVAVACDENDAAAHQHLLDSEVRLLIGPMAADSIQNARLGLEGQAVLFAPYADAPALEAPALLPSTSLVSCKPNRSGSQASLLAAAHFVQEELHSRKLVAEGSKAVLALSDHEAGLGFAETELASASVLALSYNSEPPGQGLVSALMRRSLRPGLLIAASNRDDWSENIAAVDDSAEFNAEPYPFYLLADKQGSVLRLIGQVNGSDHPVHQRAVGLDYVLSEGNSRVHDEFQLAFEMAQAETNRAFEPGLDYVHDCVYLAVYAALAGQLRFSLSSNQLSPTSILVGLRAFSEGAREFTTTTRDVGLLLNELRIKRGDDASVKLVGGSGDFDLMGALSVPEIALAPAAQYIRPKPRAKRLYCVDPRAGFIDTRLDFTTSGAAPSAHTGDTLDCLEGLSR